MDASSEKIKIMIVDDEEEIQKSIERFLTFQPEFQNVEIIKASTFNQALEKQESFNPQVILQDINLPDGNGLQFIQLVKKKCPYVQFIVITGASDLSRVTDALSFGATDYIRKPIDMESVASIISEAIRRYGRWSLLLWDEYKTNEEY